MKPSEVLEKLLLELEAACNDDEEVVIVGDSTDAMAIRSALRFALEPMRDLEMGLEDAGHTVPDLRLCDPMETLEPAADEDDQLVDICTLMRGRYGKSVKVAFDDVYALSTAGIPGDRPMSDEDIEFEMHTGLRHISND